jgi:hypothetical protein
MTDDIYNLAWFRNQARNFISNESLENLVTVYDDAPVDYTDEGAWVTAQVFVPDPNEDPIEDLDPSLKIDV